MTFFWCEFGFGKRFEVSSWSNLWASHLQLSYKTQFLSHITIRSRNGLLLLHTVREDDTSKWQFFWISVSSWGTHLSIFFIFPICFKNWITIECLTLSSSATSCVFVRGSTSMIALSWLLSSSDASQYAPHLQDSMLLIFKALIPFAKFVEPPLYCMFISNSWANALLIITSCLLLCDPFWTQI